MRLKIFFALGLFFIFSLLFSAQLTRTVQATHSPSTSPTTGPVTGPVTGPLTSPASLFKITGKVTYHLFGLFHRGISRFMPAAGVHVKAVDVFNHHTVMTTTDSHGNYILPTGQKGFYKVMVHGGNAKFYVPPVQFVHVKKPQGKNNIDFKGFIFKF